MDFFFCLSRTQTHGIQGNPSHDRDAEGHRAQRQGAKEIKAWAQKPVKRTEGIFSVQLVALVELIVYQVQFIMYRSEVLHKCVPSSSPSGMVFGLPEKTKLENEGYQETPRTHWSDTIVDSNRHTRVCRNTVMHAPWHPWAQPSSSPWLMVKIVFP